MTQKKSSPKISIAADPNDTGNIELFKRMLGRLKCLIGLRGYLTVNLPDHHIDSDLKEGVLLAHADWETNTEIIGLLITYYEKVVVDLQEILDSKPLIV